ncbi:MULTISPECIES: calcium-binding protein [unclassified Phenylobacterium]|uniref:calcium-binding protein n=1 Tax=unclassified Phenylobacterium TaxID=2640670 RepID=UPI00083B32FE|nr:MULTISPECIES: calcium-binding protein [unclassified Phenylobacterium]
MATYAFETIGAAEALAFGSVDSLITPAGSSAKTTTVLYNPDGTFSVTMGERTVVFGSYFPATLSRLTFPDGSRLFVGGSGPDSRDEGVLPSTGAMYGGDGADTLTSSPGAWFVQGNQGDDRIVIRTQSPNTVYGGQGADNIAAIGGAVSASQFIQGNKGNDTLQGGDGADTVLGGQGNDLIYGTAGQDFINGNLGDDQLTGGGQLFGEGGNDIISTSGDGDTTARGGDGDDTIQIGTTGSGLHVASGDGGNDTLRAHTDMRSQLDGGDGADVIHIIRNLGSPVLYGATIDGGAGDDTVQASDADDRIRGGTGADSLNGGSGADTFIQDGATASLTLVAADRIGDWTSADRIQLRTDIGTAFAEGTAADFATALSTAQAEIGVGQTEAMAIQVGQDVVVFADASAGATIHSITVLVGRSLADISADNFV